MLYHGTSTKRLDRIKKEGLQPDAKKIFWDSDDYIYLTKSKKLAEKYANQTVSNIGGKPIIISIKEKDLDYGELKPYPFSLPEGMNIRYDKRIPVKYLLINKLKVNG